MKNKKKLLKIWIFVIVWLLIARYVINYVSESKDIWNTNPDWKNINRTESLEDNYKIIESSNQSCSTETDCETPSEYLIRSDCPYQSKCIQNICTVICPYFGDNRAKIQRAIYDCEVESVFQNHSKEVTAKLKNGNNIESIEPNIDDIFGLVIEVKDKCGEITMATE